MDGTPRIDHLVYGVAALAPAADHLERLLGVRPEPGGKHEGLGTHNALLALGTGVYLELIAPDPEQPEPERPRPFGLDTLRAPGFVGWAARAGQLSERVATARARGYDAGEVLAMSRATPAGRRLHWTLTFRDEPFGEGLVPFLIDWGDTPHPSETAPAGCTLREIRAEHPDPEPIVNALRALDVELPLQRGPQPALVAAIEGPGGTVELR